MRAELPVPTQPSTFAGKFGVASISERVRLRTLTLLAARDGNKARLDPSIASLQADIRPAVGKKKPFEHLYRLAFAYLDAGVAVERVTLAFQEMIEDCRQYAARRDRRTLGLLPFRQRVTRLSVAETREVAEADCAQLEIDEADVASLKRARAELLDQIAPTLALIDCLTEQIVATEAKG